MCVDARKTAASLMGAIKPTLTSLLTLAGISTTTPPGSLALTAYTDAETDLQNWVPGSKSDEVLELLADFQTAFSALPLPPTVEALTNIILAGIETVIGVVTANSPAPTAPPVANVEGLMGAEDIQAVHAASVAADTTAKVHKLVPGFKRSIFHSPDHQYRGAWNGAITEGHFPDSAKV
jgi:hypothetical protein